MTQAPRLLKYFSLQTKFYLCLFFLILAPLMISTMIVNAEMVSNTGIKTREAVFQTLQQTETNISQVISDTETLSLTLASNNDLQALGAFYTKPHPSATTANFSQLLATEQYRLFFMTQSLLVGNKHIDALCFSNQQGILFQYSGESIGDEVVTEDQQYRQKAEQLKGVGFWTPLYRLPDTYTGQHPYVVSFLREVNDLSAPRQLGMIRISLDAFALSQQFQETNVWNGASIFLVDQTGHIVSAPQQTLLGKPVEASLTSIFAQPDGFASSALHGANTTVFHVTVADTGLQLVLTVPDQDLDTQLDISNFVSTISIFLCLLFGIVFSLIQTKTIISPLKQLEKEMQKIPQGNFDIRLTSTARDEIGTLSRVFHTMAGRLKEYIAREYTSQIRQREAELRVLQAQINPHFLYNTLDSIRWTALEQGDRMVGEQLEALSELFRHTLNKGNDMTTVAEEIDHLRNYLFLQQSRFQEKLTVAFMIDDAVLPSPILKLLLQPVVENAIHHGLERKREKGSLRIEAAKEGQELHFTIVDDGVGVDENLIRQKLASTEERQSVFALHNIHERIQLYYGTAYGLTFRSQVMEGTTVDIRIPIQTQESQKGAHP